MSEVHEGGDNAGATQDQLLIELKEEIARLRGNDRERQDRMKQLAKDNCKMKNELRVLERLLIGQEFANSKNGGNTVDVGKLDQEKIQLDNNQLTKTLIKLTCECVVINKKFKYLRRLMKKNHRKLAEIEIAAKIEREQKKAEDKTCQVFLTDPKQSNYVTVGTTTSEDRLDDGSDSDGLISGVFYLPTSPDLPDLRLFDLL